MTPSDVERTRLRRVLEAIGDQPLDKPLSALRQALKDRQAALEQKTEDAWRLREQIDEIHLVMREYPKDPALRTVLMLRRRELTEEIARLDLGGLQRKIEALQQEIEYATVREEVSARYLSLIGVFDGT